MFPQKQEYAQGCCNHIEQAQRTSLTTGTILVNPYKELDTKWSSLAERIAVKFGR